MSGRRLALAILAALLLNGCASSPPPRIVFTESVRGYACTNKAGNVTRHLPDITVNEALIRHCDADVCGGASWTCPEVPELPPCE